MALALTETAPTETDLSPEEHAQLMDELTRYRPTITGYALEHGRESSVVVITGRNVVGFFTRAPRGKQAPIQFITHQPLTDRGLLDCVLFLSNFNTGSVSNA